MFLTKQTPKWLMAMNKGLSIVATITVIFNMSALGVFLAPQTAGAQVTTPRHELSITKDDSVDPINVGANTTYTIRVKNIGTVVEQNVTVTDTLPPELTYVPTANPVPDTVVGQTLTWNLGTININATKLVTVVAKGTVAGYWTNSASATSTDINTPVTTTEKTKVVGGVCGLVVTKDVDKTTAAPGETLTYTITYENTGTGFCTGGGVHMYDELSGLTYVQNSAHLDSLINNTDVNGGSPDAVDVFNTTFTGKSTHKELANLHEVGPTEKGVISFKVTVDANQQQLCQWTVKNTGWTDGVETQSDVQFQSPVTTVAGTCAGSLQVNKLVDENGDGKNFTADNPSTHGFEWGVDTTSPSRAMGTTASGLTVGPHDVIEKTVTDYHFVGWYPTASTEFSCANPKGTTLPISATVVANQTTSITLCNARDTGTITFHKIVEGGNAAKTDFTFNVNNSQYKDGDSATFKTKDYQLTETGPAGYSLTGATGVCSLSPTAAGVVTLSVSTRGGDCTLINTRDSGTIIVHKNVLNPDGQEVSDSQPFKVLLNGSDEKTIAEGTDATYANVPTGDNYTIVENENGNYSFVNYSTGGTDRAAGTKVTVLKNQTTEITVTNKQKHGRIKVYKDVRDYQGNDISDSTSFTVQQWAGEATGTPLATGTIQEGNPWGILQVMPGTYTFTESENENYTTVLNHYQITVGSGEFQSVTFVNNLKAPATIVATKIVCDNEADLPNWGLGGPDISATTAADFLAQHKGCHLQPDWQFQWAYDGVSNPGDNDGLSNDPAWHTFGPTDVNGTTTATIQNLQNSDKLWMREGLKPGYVKFAYGATGNESNVSAEIYCSTDVLNYDNLDYIQSPKLGGTYYCVAFNAVDKGSIKGTKINDLNGNGQIDQNEPGLSNWEIKLWNGDALIATTTTDANGNYSFDNVLAGTYSVAETMQTGWINTTPTPVTDVSVTTNHETTVNFLNFEKGKIWGYKYNDIDGNGQLDTQDSTISGWWICLNGSTCVQTDNDGKYEFSNLVGATYQITETVLPGWTAIFPTALTGYSFTIGSGDVKQGDFFNFKLGSISGTKYEDKTGNGKTQDDVTLSNWTIKLTDGNQTWSTLTDSQGNYSFVNLGPGTYTVSEVQKSGYTQTFGPSSSTTLTSGATVTDQNFGNFKLGKISGHKYEDRDGDGKWDYNEPALSGWTITLHVGDQSWTDVTDSHGSFEFTNLTAGSYSLTEENRAGWTQTDSPSSITITSGSNKQNNDFGNFKNISVRVCKIVDTNGNGNISQDPFYQGEGGWAMTLNQTTQNTVSGCTTFADLGPGNYTLTEGSKDGWVKTYPNSNGYNFTASSGDNKTYTFGNFQKASITATKLLDGDGKLNTTGDRTPAQNWKIELWQNNHKVTDAMTAADGTTTFGNLNPGTYTVKEVFDSNYFDALTSTSFNVTVSSGANSTVTFINWQLPPYTITATKIVCDVESDLPNWGNGGPDITSTTASNFLKTHPNCHLQSDWDFQYGDASASNPGDTIIGLAGAANWHTFPSSTSVSGTTTVSINTLQNTIWVREGLKDGYVPFSFGPSGNKNTNNVSAEIYCSNDVLNYDNYDAIYSPQMNHNYYCVAWNTKNDGTITGTKFNDLNGNGTWQEGEPGVAGVTISLSNGLTTTTDANGNYSFANIPVGTYTVTESTPDGWTSTTTNPVTGVAVTLDHTSVVNFGNFQNVTITACKAIGSQGREEQLIATAKANWPMTLLINGEPNGEPKLTNEDGCVTWSNLVPGNYGVQEATLQGYTALGDTSVDFGTVKSGGEYFHQFVNQLNDFNVAIEKNGPESVNAGDEITYTINWSITGNTPVDAVIHDAVPANTTFVSASNGGTESLGTVTWNLGTQNPYASGTVTVTVKTNSPLDNGIEISNTAQICGTGNILPNDTYSSLGDGEKAQGNPQKCGDDTWKTTVHSAPELGIEKTADKETVGGSENITYTILWSVAGNSQATHVKITDPFPTNTSYVSSTCGTTTGTCNITTTATDISYDLGTRLPGEGGNVTLVLQTAPSLPNGSKVTNIAQIKSDQTDPLFAQAQSITNVVTAPKLGITKTVNVVFANPGDIVKYTVVITNTGTDTAHNVTLTDTLPAGLLFADTLTPTKVYSLGDLTVGSSVTQTYDVKVGSTIASGTYNNLAKAQADNNDPVTATVPLLVNVPLLTLTKTVNVTFSNPGDTVTYTVVITNTGNGKAVNVVLTDVLPNGFIFTDSSTTKTWNIGDLNAGQSQTITYNVVVGKTVTAGTYENLATVTADNHSQLQTKAPLLIKVPAVLGATVPETGASARDYVIFLVSLLFVLAGILFVRKGSAIQSE